MTKRETSGKGLFRRVFPLMTFLDYVFLLVSLAVFVSITVSAYSQASPGAEVRIESPSDSFLYVLDKDQIITVRGPLGDSLVQIKDGKVRFLDSPCPDKICLHAGWQSNNGQWAACLPNRIFIRVISSEAGDVDVHVY